MSLDPIQLSKINALHDAVIVSDMNFEERFLTSGIVLLRDDMKSAGIRPRWGRVYAVGPEQEFVKVGDWICVAHGRWTRGVKIHDSNGVHTIRKVDPKDILLVSDTEPGSDDTISDAA
jgi:co-chaperonin GroES (HSP10)